MPDFSSISKQNKEPKSSGIHNVQKKQPSFFNPFIQPKLTINQPNDIYEKEADAMADKVMRIKNDDGVQPFFKPAIPQIQKKCAACDDEEKLQMKAETKASKDIQPTSLVNEVISSGGQLLDAETKTFMEQRFGHDFSNVQIHNDAIAHQSSAEINAKAYTHKNHIAFAPGSYQPQTNTGKQLLAHELTHVVQQNNNTSVKRKVNDSSSCSSTVDKTAPPQPMTFITLADMLASSSLSFAIVRLKLDLITDASGKLSGDAFDAYRNHFGDPHSIKGKFKDRFNGSSNDSLADAQASEMRSLIGMLETVLKVLEKGINYHCIGTGMWKVDGLAYGKCDTGTLMETRGNTRAIAICPFFWHDTNDDAGITTIHELFHIAFNFGDHDKPSAQTDAERFTEPQCYAGFVADINKVSSTDTSCPPAKL